MAPYQIQLCHFLILSRKNIPFYPYIATAPWVCILSLSVIKNMDMVTERMKMAEKRHWFRVALS